MLRRTFPSSQRSFVSRVSRIEFPRFKMNSMGAMMRVTRKACSGPSTGAASVSSSCIVSPRSDRREGPQAQSSTSAGSRDLVQKPPAFQPPLPEGAPAEQASVGVASECRAARPYDSDWRASASSEGRSGRRTAWPKRSLGDPPGKSLNMC